MYFEIKTLIFVAIVCQTLNGQVKTESDQSSAQSETGDSMAESLVPEDPEAEAEEIPPESTGETGAESQDSQSSVEEYLKEHPEVPSISSETDSQQQTKFAYNKFGDVISVPDKGSDPKSTAKPDKKDVPQPLPQQQMDFQPSASMPYPHQAAYQMSMSAYQQPGYPPVYNYPYYSQYYNQMAPQPPQQVLQQIPQQRQPLQPIQTQQQLLQQQVISQRVIQQPNTIPTKPPKPYGVVKTGKIDPNIPEDVQNHFKQSESDDEELAAVVQAAEQAKAIREAQAQQPQFSQMIAMDPDFIPKPSEKEMASNPVPQMQKQLTPNPYPNQLSQQIRSMSFLQPNQFKIDQNNMQVIPMSLPGGDVIDQNVMRKLQSGAAQLDMGNARIIPMPLHENKTKRPTEAPTIEDFPEMPEVVIKKRPKPKRISSKKTVGHLVRNNGEKSRHVSHTARKPTFILRARLSNLPKKNQKGKNQWWKRPIPKFCYDPIIEITDCDNKKLEKRWSYNPEDERCYLYEDYCAKVKKNTFKNINQCMMTCWRPK